VVTFGYPADLGVRLPRRPPDILAAMRPFAAGALVFVTSAAVLVLEILAARLLAPYVGVTLETYTGIIGTILAAIALGTWIGGKLADRFDPASLLGPILFLGGALSLGIVPIVRLVGTLPLGGGPVAVLILVTLAFFAPAAVLSAVPPTVIKLQLADLAETGRTVGRLSALGTAGAIFGTFVTGFVLVATVPTTPIVVGVAIALMVLGALIVLALRRSGSAPPKGRAVTAVLLLIVPVGLLGVFVERSLNPCEKETAYFCARVLPDLAPCIGGLTLYLDTLRHSCVHPGDPERLDFTYAQVLSDVIAAKGPNGAPLNVLHIGGGGFSMPRYLQSANPGSQSLVLELDPELVQIARDELGLVTSPDLQVRTGDARLGIAAAADDSFDLVIGDAFGGQAVPWHLATKEFVDQVDRVLRPDGVYAINVIDYPPLGFARAEAATLAAVFDHVAVIAPAARLAGEAGGNLILLGSHQPIDVPAILAANAARGDDDAAFTGAAVIDFIDDVDVLTDDYAPVDQLLSSAR
jgi:MFS family permease